MSRLFAVSGILLGCTNFCYDMVGFPNVRYNLPLSSRDHVGPSRKE